MSSERTSEEREDWALFALLIVTSLGLYLRLDECFRYGLGGDDYDHLRLPTGSSLWKVFLFSYNDLHPPLRNCLLYLIRLFSSDSLSLRLIGIVPGTLAIPALYATTSSFGASPILALFAGSVVAFADSFVFISVSTRPYPMVWLFMCIYFYAWFSLMREYSLGKLVLYGMTGIVLVLLDYGIILMLFSAALCGQLLLLQPPRFERRRFWSFIGVSFLHGMVFGAQYLYFLSVTSYRIVLDYTGGLYPDLPKILSSFVSLFQDNFFYSTFLAQFMGVLFLCSLLIYLQRREWVWLLLVLLPFSLLIAMSSAGLHPFAPGRWTLPLSFFSLIFMVHGLSLIVLKFKDWEAVLYAGLFIGLFLNILGSYPVTGRSAPNFHRGIAEERGAPQY